MNNFLNLKQRVMIRVYVEYVKNIFIKYPDYFMLFVFMATSFMLVSTHDVLSNAPKDSLSNVFNFFIAALQNTSWIIQVLIAGFLVRTAVAGVILARKNIGNKWSLIKLRY